MDNLSGRRYLCVHCWRVYVGEVPIVCACGENHYCSCSECQQLIDALLAGALGRDERLSRGNNRSHSKSGAVQLSLF